MVGDRDVGRAMGWKKSKGREGRKYRCRRSCRDEQKWGKMKRVGMGRGDCFCVAQLVRCFGGGSSAPSNASKEMKASRNLQQSEALSTPPAATGTQCSRLLALNPC